jgi:hypothetical protein
MTFVGCLKGTDWENRENENSRPTRLCSQSQGVPLTRDALTRCSPVPSSSRLTPPASRLLPGSSSLTALANRRCRRWCHSLGQAQESARRDAGRDLGTEPETKDPQSASRAQSEATGAGDLIRKRTELVSRDARASGLKCATPCHVCLSSDRTARAEPLLLIAEGDTPFRVAFIAEMREHPG